MDPRSLVRRFAGMIAARDEASARGLCAGNAWDAATNSLAQLYRQLTGRGRRWTLEIAGQPRTSESPRAVVRCNIKRQDRGSAGTVAILCDRIPCRVVGWTKSDLFAERFLDGVAPPHLGLDDLDQDERMHERACELAEMLARAAAGDPDAAQALQEQTEGTGPATEVMRYLQTRTAAGAQLEIMRTLRFANNGRVIVDAALMDPPGRGLWESIWLYADEGKNRAFLWRDRTAIFDMDTLLQS